MDSGVGVGLGESPSRAEVADAALDDALLEAAACGDVGFLDRVTGRWSADADGVLGGRGAPTDPVDVIGAVEWLRLAARVRNQSDARFLAALHLVAHHGGARDHADHPVRDPFPADEVGAALGWSTGSASYQLGLADAIVQRLPKLYEAMAEGWLDLGKATTVVEATRAMPDDLAGMAVAHVLPVAAGVSKAELALRLDVAAGQLDPDWATRRERAARRNVRVEGIRNPTGTDDVALRARRMLHHTCHGDVPVECRLVLVDADGHLEHVLLMPLSRHRRPRPTARGIVIVELAIPTTDLVALDPATPRPTRSGTRGCAAPSSASSPSPSGARSSAGHATPPPPPTTPPAA